jgi:hypothetical protein
MSTKSSQLELDPPDQAQQSEALGSNPELAMGTVDVDAPKERAKRIRRSAVFTSTPDVAPPRLLCPSCDVPLVYRQTVLSGVKPIERWDYFDCRTCGAFVYRDRTRKLRPTM